MNTPAELHETFEGHQLLEVLGRGGQATVYLARHPQSRLPVALKVLEPPPGGYPPDVIGRFRREVEALTGLSSPHTVRLLRHGQTAEGILWLAFEYIEGFDLHDWLERERNLPSNTVREILVQLLNGLQEAHRHGIVHRDIKPQNIRIAAGPQLRAVLIDFGIARDTSQAGDAVTALGELIGTPRYMSPEHLRGREITPAADIYSLGLVGLEMLFGPDVLAGNRLTDQLERAQTQHSFEVEPIEGIDGQLLRVVQRMSLADIERRFTSAGQVLEALNGTTREMRSQRRPSKTPMIAAGVVTLFAIAVGVILWAQRTPEHAPFVPHRVGTPSIVVSAHEPDAPTTIREDVADVATDVATDAAADAAECRPFAGFGYVDDPVFDGRYLAYIPKSLSDGPAPLIVFYNDAFTSDPARGLEDSGLTQLAEREGFILIAPFDEHIFGHIWIDSAIIDRSKSAIDALPASCIDQQRIYAVGNGNGGHAVDTLRCDRFAAIVNLRFRRAYAPPMWVTPAPGVCETPIPRLHVAATADCRWANDGGLGCNRALERTSLADAEELWRSLHACETAEVDLGTRFGATCHTWKGCDAPSETCVVDGASVFPRSPLRHDKPYTTANTPELVWDFLKKHTRAPE